MPSVFVSGGTIDHPVERDDEWLRAQQELEDLRRRKANEAKHDEGKSLYDILQQNKAAKQEAFEESIRLKNQFRNLDEDEVEFLDAVLESTRAKEEAVKKETMEQLEFFRRQQEEADRDTMMEPAPEQSVLENRSIQGPESTWAVNARKRKRVRERHTAIDPKQRKSSSSRNAAIMENALGYDRKSSVTGVQALLPSRPEHGLPCEVKASTDMSKRGGSNAGVTCVTSTTGKQVVTTRSVNDGPLNLGLGDYGSDEDG